MTRDRLTRYDIRKDAGPDTYEIYDTWTGRTAVIDGRRMEGIKLDCADGECDLLNSEGYESDQEMLH